jgi:hypothetical protein
MEAEHCAGSAAVVGMIEVVVGGAMAGIGAAVMTISNREQRFNSIEFILGSFIVVTGAVVASLPLWGVNHV